MPTRRVHLRPTLLVWIGGIAAGLWGCLPEGWPPPPPPKQAGKTPPPKPQAAQPPVLIAKPLVAPGFILQPAQPKKPYAATTSFRVVDVRFTPQAAMDWKEYGLLNLCVELNRPVKDPNVLLKNMVVNLSSVKEGKALHDSAVVMARVRSPEWQPLDRTVYYCCSQKGLTALWATRGDEVECEITIQPGQGTVFPLVSASGEVLDGDGDGQPGGFYRKTFRARSDLLWKPGVTIRGSM